MKTIEKTPKGWEVRVYSTHTTPRRYGPFRFRLVADIIYMVV